MVLMKVKKENLQEFTRDFCKEVEQKSRDLNSATIVGLYGELGSGKTAFVKEAGVYFGISEPIVSPTFVIEKIYRLNEYKIFKNLIHIDAYRLKEGNDLKNLGWDDIIKNPLNIIFLEWPENVSEILSEQRSEIKFEFISEELREIKVEKL